MTTSFPLPLSVLDLSPIVEGSTAAVSFQRSLALARLTEQQGFTRYWLAEHHATPGVGSAATAVLIGHIAAGTQHIRVGSGGIMLPNHSPLVIAEQFGTLASLYPGRIDLGLGRAPGTDGDTMRALRRRPVQGDDFAPLLVELQGYLAPAGTQPGPVRAIPGEGLGGEIPIWLLGSSDYSAQLAAYLGMPFAFASHFAPDYLLHALQLYRAQFRPGAQAKPHAMVGVQVVVADTDAEAQYQFTTVQQHFLNLRRGRRDRQIPPPVANLAVTPEDASLLAHGLREAIVGSPDTVREKLLSLVERTQADEIIVVCGIHDHEARLRSYELLAELWRETRLPVRGL